MAVLVPDQRERGSTGIQVRAIAKIRRDRRRPRHSSTRRARPGLPPAFVAVGEQGDVPRPGGERGRAAHPVRPGPTEQTLLSIPWPEPGLGAAVHRGPSQRTARVSHKANGGSPPESGAPWHIAAKRVRPPPARRTGCCYQRHPGRPPVHVPRQGMIRTRLARPSRRPTAACVSHAGETANRPRPSRIEITPGPQLTISVIMGSNIALPRRESMAPTAVLCLP